jgi:hypothetical protein
MTTRISEIVRGYLGWCPVENRRSRTEFVNPDLIVSAPPESGSLKARAYHWLGLLRNQVLLYSFIISATGFWMFAGLGGGSSPGLFLIGILAGVPISAVTGIWYRGIFDEVLREGPLVLMSRQDKTSGILTAIGIAVSFIPVLVLLGVIPGITMEMMLAFMGGFVAVLLWGMFIAILKWESATHRRLHFDGMILELEKGNTCAIR